MPCLILRALVSLFSIAAIPPIHITEDSPRLRSAQPSSLQLASDTNQKARLLLM